jgi:hypothetical protein
MKSALRTLSCDAQRGNGNIPRDGILDCMTIQSEKDLTNLLEETMPARSISRRDASKRLLAGMAAGAAAPWMSASHPIWRHFENDELLERADSAGADEKKAFLNPEQFGALVAAAETILPGSTKAGVAKFIDVLLSVDSPHNQKEFLDSLGKIEAESTNRFGKGIAQLSPLERSELFTAVSTAGDPQSADGSARKAFLHLREWVAGSYYSSGIGMRELGWMPDRVFAEFPGCSHDVVGH